MKFESSLVENVQESHRELSDLVGAFQKAFSKKERKKAQKILCKINEALSRHFTFEANYLYPRMQRLMLETLNKLSGRQQEMNRSLIRIRWILNKKGGIEESKNSKIKNSINLVAQHIGDCADIVLLAKKFGDEEKTELNERFKECLDLKR